MHQLSRFVAMAVVAVGAMAAVACDDDDDDDTGPSGPSTTTFTVLIENVSTNGTLSVTRLSGVVPLSPGVYALYSGLNPIFTIGDDSGHASESLERLAEDGDNSLEAARLAGLSFVESGTFDAPGGPDNTPLIHPGESATFTITAAPGDRLQIATMFAQSNDWFFAFGGAGLDMFTGGTTPVSGDVTSQIVLLDAGTEADEPPGAGADQATAQAAPNTGATDPDSTVRIVSSDSTLASPPPPVSSVIRVTITPGG